MSKAITVVAMVAVTLSSDACARRDADFCDVRSYRTSEQAVESIQKLPRRSDAMEAEAYQNQLNDCINLEAATLRRSYDPAETVARVVVNECHGFTTMPLDHYALSAADAAQRTHNPQPTYQESVRAFEADLYEAALGKVVAWRAKDCGRLVESYEGRHPARLRTLRSAPEAGMVG